MSNLNKIVNELKAKKMGASWMACCPAHDDQNPSLSIRETPSGKILLFCFAGCTYAEIINELKNLGIWSKYER